MAQAPEITINSNTQQPSMMMQEQDIANDNGQQAIKFIEEHLNLSFDEVTAKKLFDMYVLDDKDYNLQAPDVRKLLFDILTAAKWPLVVPDEILDNVLHEFCSNDRLTVSWTEFKAYFVFLENRPLDKLFQITTKICDKQQLEFARLISIKPVAGTIENPTYDRALFKQKIGEIIPDVTSIFIYFLGENSLLALAIGNFAEKLSNVQISQIIINDMTCCVEIRQFDTAHDMFPPLARAGGFKSKVARKIADTYMTAKQWDEGNLKVGSTTTRLVRQASQKLQEIDDQFKIQEKASTFTKDAVESLRDFDLQHQISRRMLDTAKTIDTKYQISNAVQTAVDNIQSNPIFQRIVQLSTDSINTVDDIHKETKQLVQGKEIDSHMMHSSQNQTEGPQNIATNNQNIHDNIDVTDNNQQV